MNLSEKAAYIKGLADGLKLDETKDENKVIKELINIVSDMANRIDEVQAFTAELMDSIEDIDEAVADLEDEVYDDGELYDDDCDCCDYDDGDTYYEATCPNCGEVINIEEDLLLMGETKCPNCGEELEFDLSALDDDSCDCCDCSSHDHSEEE